MNERLILRGVACRTLICAALLVQFIGTEAQAGERLAVLVANNAGLPHEPTLRHTGDDARRMAAVLQELGHFDAGDIWLVSEHTAQHVLNVLREHAERPEVKMLFFYYSGHGDATSLHLQGTRLPLSTLIEALSAAQSPLQVIVLDACQSGAASRLKGSQPGPAFKVRLVEPAITGQIVIASSAADEQSYESDAQRGALFTTHWISGLRGAADRNADGQVTLGEAYAYAYVHTLRETLLSGGGPQHASFRWRFAAQQEPILTYLHQDAHLSLHSSTDGVYVVFTPAEGDVLAEVPLRRGEHARLTLAAGSYVIKKHDTEALRAAQVTLDVGDDRELFEAQMAPVPFVRLSRKGAFSGMHLTSGLGQYATLLGPRGLLQASVGGEVQRETMTFGARLLLSTGEEIHAGLRSQESYVGPAAYVLKSFGLGPYLRAGLGPQVGALVWRQHSADRQASVGAAVLLGVQAALHTRILPRLALGLRSDVAFLGVRSRDALPRGAWRLGELTFLPWASYNVDMTLAW